MSDHESDYESEDSEDSEDSEYSESDHEDSEISESDEEFYEDEQYYRIFDYDTQFESYLEPFGEMWRRRQYRNYDTDTEDFKLFLAACEEEDVETVMSKFIRDEMYLKWGLFFGYVHNNLEIVKFMIENRTDDMDMGSHMAEACRLNRLEVVELLAPYVTNSEQLSGCLSVASFNGWLDIVKFMISMDVCKEDWDWDLSIRTSLIEDHMEIMHLLYDYAEKQDIVFDFGNLIRCLFTDDAKMAKFFIYKNNCVISRRTMKHLKHVEDFKLYLMYYTYIDKSAKNYGRLQKRLETYPLYPLLFRHRALAPTEDENGKTKTNEIRRLPTEIIRLLHTYL